jgi:hypothetical protein
MRENIVEPDRSRLTIWYMHIAYCITKVMHTHIHTQYVILYALLRQQ